MSDLVIDIADLPRAFGSVKALHLDIPAPEQLGNEVIGVLTGSNLDIHVTVASMDEGVFVEGLGEYQIHGECVRCLGYIDELRSLRIGEIYYLPEAAQALRAQGDEESEDLLVLEGNTLDLEPALRDAIIPTLPLRPLCSPECPGLCPECGERLADVPADHHHEVIDPRWSALAGLVDQAEGEAAAEAADRAQGAATNEPEEA